MKNEAQALGFDPGVDTAQESSYKSCNYGGYLD